MNRYIKWTLIVLLIIGIPQWTGWYADGIWYSRHFFGYYGAAGYLLITVPLLYWLLKDYFIFLRDL